MRLNQPELNAQKALEEEVTNHDNPKPETMEEITNRDDPQQDTMVEVTNCDDPQSVKMEEVTNCDDPQLVTMVEVINHDDPQLDTMEEVTNCDVPQPVTMEEVTNCDDPQPVTMKEVTNHDDPQLDTMEEIANRDDPQPDTMKKVTNRDDPQLVTNVTMEEVTNHDDPQPGTMEEVTNRDNPQPGTMEEVTKRDDPQPVTMEEVTKRDDPQPVTMEEVTNHDEPDTMEEVTNHDDPQPDAMEEVTNHDDPQPVTMEEVSNHDDPQPDAKRETAEEVTNHDDPQPETMETPGAPTIIDRLNAYCWRIILDHLNINDILLTESVCRAWQQMVIEYFTGVHKYQVVSSDSEDYHNDYKVVILKDNKESGEEFVAMITRFGPMIVNLATNYITKNGYQAIADNCPNLEDLTLYTIQIQALIQRFPKVYNKLKRLRFEWCDCLEDDCLSVMVLAENIEELTIKQFEVPGNFMAVFKWSQLKTLSMNYCEYLLLDDRSDEFYDKIEPNYILKKLVLDRNADRVIWEMCYLLEKLPNLEELSIKYCKMMDPQGAIDLVEAIRGLKHLKHLNMKRNNNVSDDLLKALASGCKELRTLNIGYCVALSGSAVAMMCEELPNLTELYVPGVPKITDDQLITCINACPELKELDASGCARVSARVLAAARARARPLRLRLVDTALTAKQVVEELSQNGQEPRMWDPVPGCFWSRKVTRKAQARDIIVIWNEIPVASSSGSDQDITSDLWRVFKEEKDEE